MKKRIPSDTSALPPGDALRVRLQLRTLSRFLLMSTTPPPLLSVRGTNLPHHVWSCTTMETAIQGGGEEWFAASFCGYILIDLIIDLSETVITKRRSLEPDALAHHSIFLCVFMLNYFTKRWCFMWVHLPSAWHVYWRRRNYARRHTYIRGAPSPAWCVRVRVRVRVSGCLGVWGGGEGSGSSIIAVSENW